MQRHTNTQVSSLIVLLSIVTILTQFASYYFLANVFMIWAVSSAISILCCHILLESSSTYESCFIYSILTIFISLTITILTYGKGSQLITYSHILIGIIAINWFLPMLHCFLRHMVDYGTRVENFISFYRNSNLVFLLFYLAIFIYSGFISKDFPWMYHLNPEEFSFIPFWTLAAHIEDYLFGTISFYDLITYVFGRIILYIPFGFYIALLFRRNSKLIKLVLVVLFPILVESAQYYMNGRGHDMDDVIYGILGGLIGFLCYWLLNLIYTAVSGKDFLSNDREYRFSNHSLHF